MEELLDAVLELVGLLLAHILDPRPVMAERWVGHGGVQRGVVDAVELKREEQEMDGGRGQPLLHVAVELGARRVAAVAGIEQRGVGDQPPERVLDCLVALERLGQRLSGALPVAIACSLPL